MSGNLGSRPEMDVMKMLQDFKMPGMPDMEALANAQRKNLEALSNANRVALEGAQAVARRHMEIVQQAMTETTDALKHMSTPEGAQAKAAKQADLMKAAYEKAVNNMRELADLIQKSNGEALAVLNRRFTDAMDEVQAIVHKPS